jgi:membrane protein implicated in regulation of membrane protease activity
MNEYVVLWIVAIVVFLLVEAFTAGLTTIWFAGGAVVALALALFDLPLYAQALAFAVISAVLLIFTRPLLVDKLNRNPTRTNADSLVGGEAGVVEEIG